MLWQIHYMDGLVAGFYLLSGRARAIDRACELLEAGSNVLHLVTAHTMKGIGPNEIREIHAQRRSARLR